ncbi:MAG: cysteine desulfurase NifS [Andreesenia angusta]|nr:cysteine desulfurase NifS [Andreesenia angusta]
MDNAATTKVKEEVLNEMLPYFTEKYGNPSSIYRLGRESRNAVEEARKKIAKGLNADPKEIFFTSGGSEADNWAIKMAAEKLESKGKHIITTEIEHHAVLHTCQYLEKKGYEVTYLPVDEYGMINLEDLKSALRDDTILVTIMFANNEIGTIQPIKEIGEIVKNSNALFHTDAVQAIGAVDIDVRDMNIDMLSASAHKIHGPKGIGFLYAKKGIRPIPLIHGGAQERSKRAGTENVPYIVGYGKAFEIATNNIKAHNEKLIELRNYLMEELEKNIEDIKLNGHRTERLPGNVNYSFLYIEGESLLLSLDLAGVAASSGSACTSGSLDPSHVLLAIGLPHEIAHGSLRLSLSEFNTKEEIDYVVKNLKDIVARLREWSPLYQDKKERA